jgi:hypothetical protein
VIVELVLRTTIGHQDRFLVAPLSSGLSASTGRAMPPPFATEDGGGPWVDLHMVHLIWLMCSSYDSEGKHGWRHR